MKNHRKTVPILKKLLTIGITLLLMLSCVACESYLAPSTNNSGNSSNNNLGNNANNTGNSNNGNSANLEKTDGTLIYVGSSVKAANTDISGEIVIPAEYGGVAIDTIPADAFKNCYGITSVVVPDSVTSIGKGAFGGCRSLRSMTLPFVGSRRGNSNNSNGAASFGYIFGRNDSAEGTTTIAQYWSSGNYDCEYFTFPSTLRTVTITDESVLGYGAFYNCSMLTEINLNENILHVGECSFYNCNRIETIDLPSISVIPAGMLSWCTSLKTFTINQNVESIDSDVFYMCTALQSINSETAGEYVIPESVLSIGYGAFCGCRSIRSMTLPFVGNRQGNNNNSNGAASFGYIFGRKDSAEGTTTIAQYWSTGNYDCEYFTFPSTLRTVTITDESVLGYGAFINCSMLTEININSEAKNDVGRNAFYNTVSPNWID